MQPPLNQLTDKINSKYLVATTAAKTHVVDEKPETALLNKYISKNL